MVWSPPMVMSEEPSSVRSIASCWIASMASPMSNGFTAMSPASTTWACAKGEVSVAGLYGRSSREDCRTWPDPKRAPGR